MPKKTKALKIIPLGGLDGIGKNMTAFECGDDLIVIDCGLMFPDDNQPGIDLVLPDYTYILEHADKLRGILITHGHEDHIGAIPYLLADLHRKVPIYSSKLSLGFINAKLAEHKVVSPKLCEVKNGDRIQLGSFEVNFFSITHSIPGALGMYVKTSAGSFLHTGDFKFDQTPIDGVTTNFNAICRFAEEGIDVLLADSTNATRPGFTPSESSVGPSLRHIIKNAKGRVFVASFSSHIHRIQQVCDAAVSVGRKVVVTGRSMITNTRIARDLGYLKISPNNIIDAFDLDTLPDDKIVVMCTGSQGEPMSALARMATGDHKSLTITASDTVIISATPVPGNEKSVQGVINLLSKTGCDVYDRSKTLVHVSGHASQEELKLLLAMTHPRYFVPVHGEAVHQREHAKLAQKMGIKPDHIFIADNGDELILKNHKLSWGDPVNSGVIYVDGLSVTDANPVVFRDRQKLSRDGIFFCVATVTNQHKLADIELSCRGVSFNLDDISQEALNSIKNYVEVKAQHENVTIESYQQGIRRALSQLLWSQTRTRPMIIPVVMEV